MVSPEELEAIRARLGLTQAAMAKLLDCDYLSYKRYATGARTLPRYIARSALMLDFIRERGLLSEWKNELNKYPLDTN